MATHTFATMGTVASIRFHGPAPQREVLAELEAGFVRIEQRFSLFRANSEISRIARGELTLMDSSDVFRDSYARALEWRTRSNDAFSPHRSDGVIDLSGIVKAQAMEEGEHILDAAGVSDWLFNVGGDILANGNCGNEPWRVGVIDPHDRDRLLCTRDIDAPMLALATSGTAERGEHIWRTDQRKDFVQVSVLGADIVTADVLATAILAGGEATCHAMLDAFGDEIDVLTVDCGGNLTATPRFAPGLSPALAHGLTSRATR